MWLCFHQVSHKARCLKIHMTIKTLNSANKPTHSQIFKERITFIFKPSLTCGRCKLSIACCAENGNHWTHFLSSELFFHFANTTSSSLRNSINKQKERITTHLPKISSLTQAIKKNYTNYLWRVFCMDERKHKGKFLMPVSSSVTEYPYISNGVPLSFHSMYQYLLSTYYLKKNKNPQTVHTAAHPSVCSRVWGTQPTKSQRNEGRRAAQTLWLGLYHDLKKTQVPERSTARKDGQPQMETEVSSRNQQVLVCQSVQTLFRIY